MSDADTKPIVVGIDTSAASRKALAWAAHEAAKRAAPLEIVHARYYVAGPVMSSQASDGLQFTGSISDDLDDAEQMVADIEPGLTVRTIVYFDGPIDALVERSRNASMVVLGAHEQGRIAGAVLGSITQSVAAHAHCPVVVINEAAPNRPSAENRIVVGVSEDPSNRATLRFAFAEADRRGGIVVAVHSWADVSLSGAGIDFGLNFFEDWRRLEANRLSHSLASFIHDHPTVPVEKRLVSETAHRALLAEAVGAEMLVVGCRRDDDHWFSRLGPVASWLLHRAPCPLVIVGHSVENAPSGGSQKSSAGTWS
jgi:nucleotide-binding universal stress UspA family protein